MKLKFDLPYVFVFILVLYNVLTSLRIHLKILHTRVTEFDICGGPWHSLPRSERLSIFMCMR